MYLLNDNSIDKSNVCISTKVNISTFKIYIFVWNPQWYIIYQVYQEWFSSTSF